MLELYVLTIWFHNASCKLISKLDLYKIDIRIQYTVFQWTKSDKDFS